MKIPISNLNKISINENIVCIQFKGSTISISFRLNEFPYHWLSNEITDKNKIEIIRYLLTSDKSPVKNIYYSKTYCKYKIELKNPYKFTEIEADPKQGFGFNIETFQYLSSMQWHMITHCMADHFFSKKKQLAILICKTEELSKKWNEFVSEIKCPRWGIGLTANDNFEQWKKIRRDIDKKYNKKLGKESFQGCKGCIEEHGLETFIECLRFFEGFRTEYLRTIKQWIVNTIRDQQNIQHYKDEKTICDDTVLNRRHIHTENAGLKSVYAYVMNENNGITNIYRMIFDFCGNINGNKTYQIKTAYGIGACENEEESLDLIREDVADIRRKKTITNYCHESNWPQSSIDLSPLTQKFNENRI